MDADIYCFVKSQTCTMPAAVTKERIVCFSDSMNEKCALTLSSLTSVTQNRDVVLATIETTNTEGLCIRVLEDEGLSEKMPLYVSRAGRCVFNGTDVVDDDDPDISTCVVRVHGVVKADGFEGLPSVVSGIEIDADYGNIIYTTTDNVRHSVPIVSRKLDAELHKLRSDVDETKKLLSDAMDALAKLST